MIWLLITNLGDSALMLPSIAIILLWLLDARAPGLAGIWAAICSLAILLVAVSKIAFLGWGFGIAALDFTGISGHSTLSMIVFTTAAFLLVLGRKAPIPATGVALGCAIGLVIAYSRVLLHYHSAAEAIAGAVLGAAAASGFIAAARRHTLQLRRGYFLALALILPMVLFYGQRAPAEGLLTRVALHLSGHPCAFSRAHPHDLVCGYVGAS